MTGIKFNKMTRQSQQRAIMSVKDGDKEFGFIQKNLSPHNGEDWCSPGEAIGRRVSSYFVWMTPGIMRTFDVPLWSDPRLTLKKAKNFFIEARKSQR